MPVRGDPAAEAGLAVEGSSVGEEQIPISRPSDQPGHASDGPGSVAPADDRDDFGSEVDFGRVVGSREPGRPARRGVDKEGVIGVKRNALRFRPLATHGWGRAAIAYGPYRRRAGLAVAFHVLNSHNGAETYELEPLIGRIRRFLLASSTDSLWTRLRRWPGRMKRETISRRLACWLGSGKRCGPVTRVLYELRPLLTRMGAGPDGEARGGMDVAPRGVLRGLLWRLRRRYDEILSTPFARMRENLAIGWFPVPVPHDPTQVGNCMVVRGSGPNSGELAARVSGQMLPLFRDLPNIPMLYIVILRSVGAAYYAASLPGAAAVAGYPMMRPLALDLCDDTGDLYAGIHPAVMGEVGFSADTILRDVRIADLAEHRRWYGTAAVADSLIAPTPAPLRAAEEGGIWRTVEGGLQRTRDGAAALDGGGTALLTAAMPIGLIHAVVDLRSETADAAILWRASDAQNGWEFSISHRQGLLRVVEGGKEVLVQRCALSLAPGRPVSLQILDDAASVTISVNGTAAFEAPISSGTHAANSAVGLRISAGPADCFVRSFEAHPRAVPIPRQLRVDAGWIGTGEDIVVSETFAGPRSDFDGYIGSAGIAWRRILGSGRFEVDGSGAVRVVATPARPASNRTAYGIAWRDAAFADIAVRIDVPGTKRGDGEACRAGLIFWQDDGNYFIVNIWLDDNYPSAAVSSFFYLNGFEDVYDAVWTNLGGRVAHGGSHELRVAFDGDRYCAYLDGEPVLYRAVSDVYLAHRKLDIRRVGLVANWEWGLDTGSRFSSFIGRSGLVGP